MKYVIILLSALAFNAYGSKIEFVDELISEGDFHRAMTFAKESEFHNRGTQSGFNFQKKIVEIHLRSQDFELFDIQVERLIERYSNFLPPGKDDILRGESVFLMGNYGPAFLKIKKTEAPDEEKKLFAIFAGEDFQCSNQLCEELNKKEKRIFESKNYKNESLALILGIVPGLGQYYAGQKSSAIATFLLNSFFITTSIIAFNNNENAAGIASSLVGVTFYASSIYAGYEAARRYNVTRVESEKKKLKDIPIKIELINIIYD